MTYKALYRKWRPGNFNEIAGQEHITRTLQNALKNEQISHAYLFCGTRGTGKTSTAKVLARALNCLNLDGAGICNECDNCTSIAAGYSMDVIEIDAASNRGIDEIRDLREKVNLSPSGGIYKVYIIDEVHMLTNEAFNALLKTLEEPPSHVIFILATTEPHKVPMTIISRCQRFDFKPITDDKIISRLLEISNDLELDIEKEALQEIAGAAEGSLRDAINILDQVSTIGKNKINKKEIHNIMGTVNEHVLYEMKENILSEDVDSAVKLVDDLFTEGKDLRIFSRQLGEYLRDFLIKKETKDKNLILHIIKLLVRYEQDMKWSSHPRLLLELFLFESVYGSQENTLNDISLRLARLEKKVEEKDNFKLINNNVNIHDEVKEAGYYEDNNGNDKKDDKENSISQNSDNKNVEKDKKSYINNYNDNDVSLEKVKKIWPRILQEVRKKNKATVTCLESCWLTAVSQNILTLGFEVGDITKDIMEKEKNKQVLVDVLGKILGGEWTIRCSTGNPPLKEEKNPDVTVDKAMEIFNAEEVNNVLPDE
ncbi:MAG: DNA polymerase III subunit gamma/tau [Clostridiales bacterium]|nr:DNA polymerase III subunit gamma/tau [Clostridiales bacterium]MCF8021526.1 DNA polymerase III subunit gamma/tau [Clostridiales bacterium]